MKTTSEQEYHEIDCPGCGDKIKIPKQPATHTVSVNGSYAPEDIEKAVERAIEKKIPKEPEKPKEVEVPSYLPKHFCNNPNGCEGHDNPKRKRVTKKCNNCDQVSPQKAKQCPWCGEKDFDDLDDDELERFNKGMEHEHEHE